MELLDKTVDNDNDEYREGRGGRERRGRRSGQGRENLREEGQKEEK